MVWEVLAADLSISSDHTAGLDYQKEKGIALRFPRFIKIREDKAVVDATNSEEIINLFEM